MLYCIATLCASAIFLVLAACSNAPGSKALVNELLPFTKVFQNGLGISHHTAAWLSVPAVFTTGFGFMFALSRQIHSMSLSGMIPTLFKERTAFSGSPYIALIVGGALCLIVCIPIGYKYTSFQEDIFNWCMICSYCCYICTFISFVELRRKYAVVGRYYVNPLGIPSAVVGVVIFTMNFISAIAFQGEGVPVQHRIHPIGGFGVLMILAIIWYLIYARKYQCFSGEEQKIMFSAYVIKCKWSCILSY